MVHGKIVAAEWKNGSGRVGSGRVGSGRVSSGRVGSGRVGSGRVGSGRVGPGRVGWKPFFTRPDPSLTLFSLRRDYRAVNLLYTSFYKLNAPKRLWCR